MSHRFRHHAAITSLDARDAEIADAWHVGRASLLWAMALVIAAIVGAPPTPTEELAMQPDPDSVAASSTWGA